MKALLETIEWRLIAIFLTFVVGYFFTGKVLEATGLTVVVNLSKTLTFYIWRRIKQ